MCVVGVLSHGDLFNAMSCCSDCLQACHLHDLNPDAAGISYEVRVYSLEAATLGQVLHAKQIKAAHCLTSVQFSPTSEHLLLAYGRSVMSMRMCKTSQQALLALDFVSV